MSIAEKQALEANFTEWSATRGEGLVDFQPWTYYCAEQFMKMYRLGDEDLQVGIIDGGGDGGADAVYVMVNDLPASPEGLEPQPKATIRVVILQMKGEAGFSSTAMLKLKRFTEHMLDFSKTPDSFRSLYNQKTVDAIKLFRDAFDALKAGVPTIVIEHYYVVRKDEATPNSEAEGLKAEIEAVVAKFYGKCTCQFNFVNAGALLRQVEKSAPSTKKLEIVGKLDAPEGHVCLVSLDKFFDFLKDQKDDSRIDGQIFESNVRGFQKDTAVNKGIRETLAAPDSAEFWLLNNGITILASDIGPAFGELHIENPQIVNGLQTSRELFAHFQASPPASTADPRRTLVRVIKTKEEGVRDQIIHANNSQNKMHLWSLKATDPFQGRIEAHLKPDYYYDIKRGRYKDEGKPVAKIVGVTELAQSVIAVVLQEPHGARSRPGDYLTDDVDYARVFDESFDLNVYKVCIELTRRVAKFLSGARLGLESEHRRNLLHYVTMHLAARLAGEPAPNWRKIRSINVAQLSDDQINASYKSVKRSYKSLGENDQAAKGTDLTKRVKASLRRSLAAH